MQRRRYQSYDEYRAHQADKIGRPGMREKLRARYAADVRRFAQRFTELAGIVAVGAKALCLGARLGAEVQALRLCGYDAIGIDLVPHPPLVIAGDMHAAPFGDGEFDLVYTNSLDHVYELDRFAAEVRRLLTRPGWLAVQLAIANFGSWESMRIDSVEEFLQGMDGFAEMSRSDNGKPPPGLRVEMLLEIVH